MQQGESEREQEREQTALFHEQRLSYFMLKTAGFHKENARPKKHTRLEEVTSVPSHLLLSLSFERFYFFCFSFLSIFVTGIVLKNGLGAA